MDRIKIEEKKWKYYIPIIGVYYCTKQYQNKTLNDSHENFKKMDSLINIINKRVSSIYNCSFIKSEFDTKEILFNLYDDNDNEFYYLIEIKVKLDK